MAAVLGTMLAMTGVARAQSQSPFPSQPSTLPGHNTGLPPIDGRAPGDVVMDHASARARAAAQERQEKIVSDTAKLLALATELKSAVDKTTKDELSLDVIRKADEIERLAHDLKTRMKG